MIGGPYPTLPTPGQANFWGPVSTGTTWVIYNDFLKFGSDTLLSAAGVLSGYEHQRVKLARAHHQMPGSVATTRLGIATSCGVGLLYPNAADNGLYVNSGKTPVIEAGTILRGYLPGFIAPYMTNSSLHRWHINTNPANPKQITRLLLGVAAADQTNYGTDTTGFRTEYSFGLDITGPWR